MDGINSDNKDIWNEAQYGEFNRSFIFSTDINKDKINAKYANGVLCITIPKVESKDPVMKKIRIS